jgi:hypothetical protein
MMMVSVPASGAPTAQLRFYSSDKPSNIRRGKRGDEIARGVKKRTGTTGAKSSGALSGLRNQTPAQNNLEKAKLAVELAEGDARKERLRVSCLERVVAKARILTANEYVELLGTTDQNTMDYIREVTTIDPYTKKEAKQELEKAELKLKEAELKLEKAELKLEKAKLERGEGKSVVGSRTDVVEAALPSMPQVAYAMGNLPDVSGLKITMKEVAVVKISNPYFESISSLYVRMRYYPPLWEEIKEKLISPSKEHMDLTIVIGQPGIGKSVGFGNYCVLRSMMDLTKTIVLVIAMDKIHVLVPRGGKSWEQYTIDTQSSTRDSVCTLIETLGVRDHDALAVHDITSAKGTVEFRFQAAFLLNLRKIVAHVHTVVLTSPQESSFGLAMKVGACTKKYLPVWSKDELESAGSFDVQGKYEYCGGVPRSYWNSNESIIEAQEQALTNFDPSLMRSVELSDKCPSQLVKLDIHGKFGKCVGLSPVSISAERLLRKSFFTQVSNHNHDRVQRSIGTEKGLQLEKWFMFWIRGSEDVAITCNIMNFSDGSEDALTVSPQCWVQVGGKSFTKLLEAANNVLNLQVGQSVFVQPTNTSFPVVDLLYFTKTGNATWEVDAFQVTVSSAHSPRSEPAKMLNDLLSTTNGCTLRRFIWVGLTAVSWSADPSCGVCTAQTVDDGTEFFKGKQCRLDMSQLVAKTSISS